jgi:glucokinase
VALAFPGVTTVLAFDLGGTRLKAALVTDLSPGPVTLDSTEALTGAQALELAINSARSVTAGAPIDAVGIAVPGLVDSGRVVALPGKFPGLTDIDLAAELERALSAPAVVINDAVAAALGEAAAGSGRGHDRMAMLTIGTGVGTAVVEAGAQLGRGPLGGGQVAGQMPLNFASEHVDTNGRSDTVEAALAAPRLLALARSRGLTTTSLLQLAEQARAGDAAVLDVVSTYRADLVTACVALIHAYTPSMLVIGGGPASGDATWLMTGVQEAVSARLWPGVHCVVTTARLGDAAALVGVAAQATHQLNAPT